MASPRVCFHGNAQNYVKTFRILWFLQFICRAICLLFLSYFGVLPDFLNDLENSKQQQQNFLSGNIPV